jgi:4-amino-4-deoxy-L-arabinose transferase-like glycosyltransferase
MKFNSFTEPAQENPFFSPISRQIILGLLFICALGIRIFHTGNHLLDFHPGRQYRSALIARAYYFDAEESIPEWRKQIVMNNKATLLLEPPIMERLASLSYHIVKGEKLWIPRLFSSLFWLIGGIFLYLLSKKLVSQDAAIFSTAFYLFIPFGILGSRTFQPDPLMVMGFLISIFTIIWYYEKPSTSRLIIAAGISALSIPIKFVSVFAIISGFVLAGICSQSFRKFTFNIKHGLFIVISILPSAIFYSYGILIAKFALRNAAQGNIHPHLLLKASFWKGWFILIGKVAGIGQVVSFGKTLGYTAFLLSLIGIFMFRDRLSRGLLAGLWLGYFLFGLIFSYTTHTHDYWHLQIIPIIALSLAPLAQFTMNQLSQQIKLLYRNIAAFSIFIILVVPSFIFFHANWIPKNLEFKKKILAAKEIGQAVNHSTKTLFLAEHYGRWLKYHGELDGLSWPTHWDFQGRKKRRLKITRGEELFNRIYSRQEIEFFVVTFIREFNRQNDLKIFLFSHFPIFDQDENYLIFDLRRKKISYILDNKLAF